MRPFNTEENGGNAIQRRGAPERSRISRFVHADYFGADPQPTIQPPSAMMHAPVK